MPIRIVCPSCSAALSVKDELAGRALKCPKCSEVIPPAQTVPTAPEPPLVLPVVEEVDEPERPSRPGSKVTARPAARARDEEEDDPPRRRPRENERDHDRPRRRRDEEEDDRPTRGRKKERSNTGLILGLVAGGLFLCCGGGVFGVWFMMKKAGEGLQELVENLDNLNPNVNIASYQVLEIGTTTRAQSEQILGRPGKVVETEDLEVIYAKDVAKFDKWMPFVIQKRAFYWRNNDDFLVVVFHPDGSADAQLQEKEWKPRQGGVQSSGNLNDAEFARLFPPKKDRPLPGKPITKPSGKPITPTTKFEAEDLAREFKTAPRAAAEKYVGQTFTVNGKLQDIEVVDGEIHVILEGLPGVGGMRLSCAINKIQRMMPFNFSRGLGMRVEGKCVGATAETISFNDCSIRGSDRDTTREVRASDLIQAYRTDASGDAKYKGQLVRVTLAEVEKATPVGTVVVVPFGRIPGSKPPARKIRVLYDPSYGPLYPKLQDGALVTIIGRCQGVKNGEIVIGDAWFTPHIP